MLQDLENLTDDELQILLKNKEAEAEALDSAQQAIKIGGLNSGYGALSSKYFRWFDPRLAESITKTGQVAIQWVERDINNYLNKLCNTENLQYINYGDTDSLYICLDQVVQKFIKETDPAIIVDKLDQFYEKKLQKVITESCESLSQYLNHRVIRLDITRENIASSMYNTAKKRYAMAVLDCEGIKYPADNPKLKIMGLEAIKNSTPRAVRGLVKEAIKQILTQPEEKLHEFIEEARETFKTKNFEEVSFNKNTNNLAKYSNAATIYSKGCPINVRAALVYNHMLKKQGLENTYPLIGEGERIKYVMLTMPNPAGSTVIGAPGELPKELGLDEYINYTTMFTKSFLDPVKAMTDAIGWHIEPVNSLEDLFEF
jgi:DNA polymerase elongation subunit (family B)